MLSHPDVKECAVIGAPDEGRGQIVEAYVVLAEGILPGVDTTKRLQDHVKATIAPFKYPRSVNSPKRFRRQQPEKFSVSA